MGNTGRSVGVCAGSLVVGTELCAPSSVGDECYVLRVLVLS
jgi:hypothetical protein